MPTRLKFLLSHVAASAALVVLAGCAPTTAFHAEIAPRPDPTGWLAPAPAPDPPECHPKDAERVCIAYAEFDDQGNPLNRRQMLQAADEAIAALREGGLVVVYAHGWHNDARKCHDPQREPHKCTRDVVQFIGMVLRLAEMPAYAQRRIRGIYIGWRGDSIPARGALLPLSMATTFWDRKAAAHRIGEGGAVYELLSRISEARQEAQRHHPDARLLIHGHSFGGALLYSALAQKLMDQIRRDARDAPPGPREPFADLVLLLNPAFEAMRLRPQLDLARSQEYPEGGDALPPRLVILTSSADWATETAFRSGRRLSTVFDDFIDDETRTAEINAVGHYRPYITHQLRRVDGCAAGTQRSFTDLKASNVSSDLGICFPARHAVRAAGNEPSQRPVAVELTRCDCAGLCAQVAGPDHHLRRGPAAKGYVPYRLPILNIRADASISAGHNDIRNGAVENFMLSLMELAATDPGAVPKTTGDRK